MCGIVGYSGGNEALNFLLSGLSRLEYRGYDSAGVAVQGRDGLEIRRKSGRLSELARSLSAGLPGKTGIGHTRWATHGAPTEPNAHPHCDCSGSIALVHNGIIENHYELHSSLAARGHKFTSETDTEVLAHLVEEEMSAGASCLADGLKMALKKVRGTWAIAAVRKEEPGVLVAASSGSPLLVGVSPDARFIASDVTALLEHTREVIYLGDGETAELTASSHRLWSADGKALDRPATTTTLSLESAEKGGFETFMLKEMNEQPRVIRDCALGMVSADRSGVVPADPELNSLDLQKTERVYMVACGSAFHAALYGKYAVERFTGLQAEADVSSEFRYRDPKLGPRTLVIVVSQSGETADTIASLRMARKAGSPVVAVCNVVGSTICREADARVMASAGPEIAVASTKAYLAQLGAMFLLALHLGRAGRTVDQATSRKMIESYDALPGMISGILSRDGAMKELGGKYCNAPAALYLGRHFNYPTALEGALKNKEISYMHSDGFPAGEMKHGPIALINEQLPVICICPAGRSREKMLSNIQEVRARKGRIITLATEGDTEAASLSEDIFFLPAVPDELSPFLAVIPLQMFAYHVARALGRDIDKPRNLAKSVTVE
jgi:glucosamine--fructose-6-phosphate aminotransferase (isomerizing)